MFIDYLDKGRTVKGEYYANLLFKVNAKAIEAKRSGRTNWQNGRCCIRTMRLSTNQSSQWLLCMTVASHFSTTLRIHQTTLFSIRLFSFSDHENTPSWEGLPVRRDVIAAVEDCFQRSRSLEKCMDRKGDYVEKKLV